MKIWVVSDLHINHYPGSHRARAAPGTTALLPYVWRLCGEGGACERQ